VLGASRIVAIVHPANTASQRVAENIGLRYIGDDRDGAIVRSVYGTSP
jgi:RimJ/RimL family protein N-acetyltransferase